MGMRRVCIGKWHLGMGWDFDRTDAFLPDRDTFRSEVFPHNLESDRRDVVRRMLAELKRIVAAGRSTPGENRSNDTDVDIWKLHTMPGVEPAVLDDY